jgi:hypothetical protein
VRYALLVVLGYSRLLWCRFYPRQDMRTLIDGLEDAFRYFDGVPQELLFDQMKAVITRDLRLQGGAPVRNLEFLRFAHHRSFTPRACRPHRAQTKGKVERPVRYLRDNFAYGRTFANDADLDQQRREWLDDVANVRVHATTRERPRDRFERDEHLLLHALAPRPYTSLVMDPPRRPSAAPAPRPLVAVMAAALIDRLVHHCYMGTIRGNSYRMRQHTDLWHALHTTQDPEPAPSRRRRARQEVATA